MSDNTDQRTFDINPLLATRRSPRAYSHTHVITARDLGPCFEAARWSASSGNSQPWSFVVGFRGDDSHQKIVDSMASGNSIWAAHASAVVANIATTHDAEGKALSHASYDVGQSVAHFSIQANAEGFVVHQMAGFDADVLGQALGLDGSHRVVTLMTVGVLGDAADLVEKLRERESVRRVRKPLADIVTPGDAYA